MGDSGFCRGNRSLINWIILPQSLLFKEGGFTIASQRTIAIKEERNNMSGRVYKPDSTAGMTTRWGKEGSPSSEGLPWILVTVFPYIRIVTDSAGSDNQDDDAMTNIAPTAITAQSR